MTPFMLRVREVLDARNGSVATESSLEELTPAPATRLARMIDSSHGADRHGAVRALAEQLVAEANAILVADGEELLLTDEALPSELAFTVRHGERAARVSMTFEDRIALGRLVGTGFDRELPIELENADALPDLLIRLIAGPRSSEVPA